LPITLPQRAVIAARAASNEPRTVSMTASFASPAECRTAGRDNAASAGYTLRTPGARQAHRVTLTVPTIVASMR
jgi:cytochrome oxidase assembly protein ShyY1